jgi:hypothetical protein
VSPTLLLEQGYGLDDRGSIPVIRRPGRDADHLPSSGTKVHAWCFIKQGDNIYIHISLTFRPVTDNTVCPRHTGCLPAWIFLVTS